ncbi:hypothetical protein PsAD2_01422 [Pseudovibrio axinellae]|uniref:Uncharacterized protein n=1 Tax=Pseudovibrio axinellae TaxID=989403 RepID=A0A166A0I7_9HYPH|nr:hypothetical protein [Pseudovibrio axinellae]KZL20490.1 hypothetical protein PsAD2_01422 [Pseudovibrio axinellae]SEQ36900.1 hypothetical protein SAMN05421798_102527 [Pseudovibrio axinellae]
MTLKQIIQACAFLSVFVSLASAAYAQEACELRKSELVEIGNWENPSAKLNELSSLEVEGTCIENQLIVRARTFTSCSPRDCKWGWAAGALNLNGALTFRFGGFFKAQHIELRPMGERMQAYMRTENHDPTIPEKTRSYILIRQ